jgi:predicted RNase H-like nuclease (RuvC/YqgF family)
MKVHIEKETVRMLESHSEELTKLKSELFEKTHNLDQKLLELDSLQNQILLNKYNYESKTKGLECEIDLTVKNNNLTINNLNNQINQLTNEIKNNRYTIEQLQTNNSQLNQNNDSLALKEEELITKYENIIKSNQDK